LAPRSRRLPLSFRFHLAGDAENELRFLEEIGPNRGTAIDVGANEGFYTYRMAQLYDKVFSFEANGDLTCNLTAYNSKRVVVCPVGLSSRKATERLYIPVVRGRALTGWASLHPGNCPDAARLLERSVEVVPLDDLNIEQVTFVKIDVEGHEFDVLQGAEQTVARWRPHVLVEVKPQNEERVFAFFAKLGYRHVRLSELAAAAESTENHIFLPSRS
jgi:FkbM family methyltransferase